MSSRHMCALGVLMDLHEPHSWLGDQWLGTRRDLGKTFTYAQRESLIFQNEVLYLPFERIADNVEKDNWPMYPQPKRSWLARLRDRILYPV
jgi:hypothetical protein